MRSVPNSSGASARRSLTHLGLAGLALSLLLSRSAFADDETAAKERAKQLFDAGNTHLSAGETEAALTAFLESRAVYPSRGNTLNAAILLQRLGRYDEALELYFTLSRTFPLDAADKERVDGEVGLLRGLTGRLDVTTEAGATLTVDGRDRGTTPLAEPLIVLSGRRSVRVTATGRAPFEATVVVESGQTVQLAAALRPATTGVADGTISLPGVAGPASPSPSAGAGAGGLQGTAPSTKGAPDDGSGLVLGLAVGPAFSTGFGGPLADACSGACTARTALGFLGTVRGGYRFASGLEANLELGFTRLSGGYENRPDVLAPQGAGDQGGFATDSLGWGGTLVGARLGFSRGDPVRLRLGLGLGFVFASVTDQREGSYDVNPAVGASYTAKVDTEQTARGASLYIAPEIGAGLRLSPAVELDAGLTVLTAIGLSALRYDGGEGVVVHNATGGSELAYFHDDELTSAPFFAFAPRLGVTFRP